MAACSTPTPTRGAEAPHTPTTAQAALGVYLQHKLANRWKVTPSKFGGGWHHEGTPPQRMRLNTHRAPGRYGAGRLPPLQPPRPDSCARNPHPSIFATLYQHFPSTLGSTPNVVDCSTPAVPCPECHTPGCTPSGPNRGLTSQGTKDAFPGQNWMLMSIRGWGC